MMHEALDRMRSHMSEVIHMMGNQSRTAVCDNILYYYSPLCTTVFSCVPYACTQACMCNHATHAHRC